MKRSIPVVLGIMALALTGTLFVKAFHMDQSAREKRTEERQRDPGRASLTFDSQELVYEGRGDLDLLKGVRALDTDGTDITDRVNGVITGRGSRNRKTIRYSVFTSEGRELTDERSLILKNYTGPRLQAAEGLSLRAEELPDLVSVLKERGELLAEDGFGRDCLNQVRWVREKISEGKYDITFSFTNAYLDHASQRVRAEITGPVDDIELALSETQVQVLAGTRFDPMDYVLWAGSSKGKQDLLGRVRVENQADTQRPGTYMVTYILTSPDNTQQARASMRVTVTGEGL